MTCRSLRPDFLEIAANLCKVVAVLVGELVQKFVCLSTIALTDYIKEKTSRCDAPYNDQIMIRFRRVALEDVREHECGFDDKRGGREKTAQAFCAKHNETSYVHKTRFIYCDCAIKCSTKDFSEFSREKIIFLG